MTCGPGKNEIMSTAVTKPGRDTAEPTQDAADLALYLLLPA
ncbi:hypothetical protein GA0070623_2782 [Micromonospora rifamycinica]|uniref:Uncharacterized protein n=1 Tax=Micromonospora rifamycinica TaxID=291594 RepID=A0A1C5IRP6_9ACTN|nr:hypothetical protein GA0070623_2782 [Micromonospora rifamycinica]